MNNTLKGSFFLFGLLMNTACALNVNLPNTRFETPEVAGKTHFLLDAGVYGESQVQLTSDITNYPPNTTNPTLQSSHDPNLAGGMAFLDSFEVKLKLPGVMSGKVQLVGNPKISEKPETFSLALYAAYGSKTKSQNDSSVWGTTYYTDMDEKIFDSMIILGYRINSLFLIYGGPFLTSGSYTGDYYTVDSGGSKSAIQSLAGSEKNTGLTLGAELGSAQFRLQIEGSYNHLASGSASKAFFDLGTNFGFYFF